MNSQVLNRKFLRYELRKLKILTLICGVTWNHHDYLYAFSKFLYHIQIFISSTICFPIAINLDCIYICAFTNAQAINKIKINTKMQLGKCINKYFWWEKLESFQNDFENRINKENWKIRKQKPASNVIHKVYKMNKLKMCKKFKANSRFHKQFWVFA